MSIPPIQMTYSGEGLFLADKRSLPACLEHFGQGEVVIMAVVEERSRKSHDHFFVTMGELFDTLPEHLADRFPNVDTFRRTGLIATGHCDTDTTVCASKAEALRLRAAVKRFAPDSVAIVRGPVVTVHTAHSQSRKAMGAAIFQKSKDDVLGWTEQFFDGQGSAGANNPRAEAA